MFLHVPPPHSSSVSNNLTLKSLIATLLAQTAISEATLSVHLFHTLLYNKLTSNNLVMKKN